jgi:ABC-type branched-subunit amino acid transport system ATPase component
MSPALEVERLSLRYGPVAALDGVSFSVAAGERVALVGPNGAGKTSLLNCISGVERPSAGRVVYRGRDLAALGPAARARLGLARTLQGLALVDDLDVRANLLLGGGRDVAEVAAALGLDAMLGDRAGALDAGARKRLELGRALASGGAVLLLDEPFAGAGPDDVELMVAAIRRSSAAALVVDHDIDTVLGLVDRVVGLEAGRVAA